MSRCRSGFLVALAASLLLGLVLVALAGCGPRAVVQSYVVAKTCVIKVTNRLPRTYPAMTVTIIARPTLVPPRIVAIAPGQTAIMTLKYVPAEVGVYWLPGGAAPTKKRDRDYAIDASEILINVP